MEKVLFKNPKELPVFFKEALCDQNNIFVFSTDVVKNSWVDWCITHPEESGVEAVSLERFTAWDKFKGEVVRGKEEDKASIPSILRKFFVSSLISQNAACPDGNTIFKKIINPDFRKDAASFADWIANILKSLKLWQKTVTAPENADYTMDQEDLDYLELYKRYSDFLDDNNFFEPSWVEPDFSATGKHYIIFYPELLEDYSDYIDIFKNCPDITVINLPREDKAEAGEKIPCLKYSDSRKELRRTILQIRKLCAGGVDGTDTRTPWDQITLCVPDLPTYRPYIERELTRYCVPFVIKAGFPLIQNTAGQVFREIQDCFNSDFSYDSMRALLLDEYIPWKEKDKSLREHLIQEGNKMRCICGFDEVDSPDGKKSHFDSWEEALKATSNKNNLELLFYQNLKHDISSICNSNSFDAILQAWEIFKKNYLETENFSETADAILGRCITELKELSQIENEFCLGENTKLAVSNHYDFFITELSKKTYTPQSSKNGIAVYPYKLSAGAYFEHQFVIDANQKNLEIQYKKLSFLNEEKRRVLGLQAMDKKFNASKDFLRLYAAIFHQPENEEIVHFSYAEKSFAGFAICHNALKAQNAENSALDDKDFILNEKNYLMGRASSENLHLSATQKTQLENFQTFNKPDDEENESESSKALLKKARYILIEKREEKIPKTERDGKIVITQTDMKNFFPCPRKWIFSKVLSLEEESLDTDLMQTFDMGTINHKILELFMKDYLKSQEPLPVCGKDGTFENEKDIFEKLKKYSFSAIKDSSRDYSQSPLSQKMLEAQIEGLAQNILNFLHEFLQPNICSKASPNKNSKTLGYGGCLVHGVEKAFSAKNEDKNYNYYGAIDLLLTSARENTDSDAWTIIDYKNTKTPAAKDIKVDDQNKLADFQMPMYISLVHANKGLKREWRKNCSDIDVARFYSIKEPKTSPAAIDKNNQDLQPDSFEKTMDAFRSYSDNFERIVTSQDFAPDLSKVDKYEDCLKCNFKSVCRRTYEVSNGK